MVGSRQERPNSWAALSMTVTVTWARLVVAGLAASSNMTALMPVQGLVTKLSSLCSMVVSVSAQTPTGMESSTNRLTSPSATVRGPSALPPHSIAGVRGAKLFIRSAQSPAPILMVAKPATAMAQMNFLPQPRQIQRRWAVCDAAHGMLLHARPRIFPSLPWRQFLLLAQPIRIRPATHTSPMPRHWTCALRLVCVSALWQNWILVYAAELGAGTTIAQFGFSLHVQASTRLRRPT
jgi:hypothetical protein